MNTDRAWDADDYPICIKCGSRNLEWDGASFTQDNGYDADVDWYVCKDCGYQSEAE